MNNFHFIPKDIKDQILARVKNEGASVPQLASEHGISDKTIYGWLKKGVTSAISFLEYSRLKRENKLLLEMVGKLTLEKTQGQIRGKHFKKN